MSVWTVTLLLLVIIFLAYRHPQTMMEYLPHWLRPAQRNDNAAQNGDDTQTEITSEVEIRVNGDDEPGTETTPKATSTSKKSDVPTLSLDGANHDKPGPNTTKENGSTTPAPSASMMPPPPKPSASLMPPPAKPTLAPPPSSTTALRAPSSGPLPNRSPPSNSQQRISGGLTVNGIIPIPNPRGKVLLSPGHSPMDWAALTRRENLSGVSTFQRVTPSRLKSMTGRKGKPAWSSWQGKVYNITPYLDFHPGGKAELMRAAGRDGTRLFMETHPWVNWENMLGSCLVGVLVPEAMGRGDGGEGLEALD